MPDISRATWTYNYSPHYKEILNIKKKSLLYRALYQHATELGSQLGNLALIVKVSAYS